MFDGQWHDFIWACLAGGLGFACLLWIDQFLEVKFFAEFVGSFLLGVVAILYGAFRYGVGNWIKLLLVR